MGNVQIAGSLLLLLFRISVRILLAFLELSSAILTKIQEFDFEEFSHFFYRSFTVVAICMNGNLLFNKFFIF